jgi:hypothetical protein
MSGDISEITLLPTAWLQHSGSLSMAVIELIDGICRGSMGSSGRLIDMIADDPILMI